MASFPGAVKTFTDPTPTNRLSSPSHSTQHSEANDEITAIESALGASLDNVVVFGSNSNTAAVSGLRVISCATVSASTSVIAGLVSAGTVLATLVSSGTVIAGIVTCSAGTGTFKVLTCTAGTAINEFSTDGTFGGDSDLAVPTEKAIKTYVTAALTGATGSSLSKVAFGSATLSTAGLLTISGTFSTPYVVVLSVFDNSTPPAQVWPDAVTVSAGTVAVSLASYYSTMAGTWGYGIIA